MALGKQDLTAIKGIVDDSIDTKVQPMIADLKQFVSDGFDGMHELIGNVEKNLDGVESRLTKEIREVKLVVNNSVSLLNNHEERITKLEKIRD